MAIRFDEIQVTGSSAHRTYPTITNAGSGQQINIQTSHGYLRLGADNASYAHITTDRPSFYFNAASSFDGDINAYGGTENIQSFNNVDAAKFRDKSNTAYYVDPSSDSILNQIHIDDYVRHKGNLNTYWGFDGNNSHVFYAGGTERMSITGDVFVEGPTDLKFTGTSRRVSFDAGTGTVRTTTANSLFFATNSTTAMTLNAAQNCEVHGDQLSVGGSTKTTTRLNLTATNTAGSPANAIEINMSGYEGRAQGIFHVDSAHSGEQWFSGLTYAGAFNTWQVGFHGTQPQYSANYMMKVDTGGNLFLKGDIYIGNDSNADTKLVYKTGGFIEVANGSIRSMTLVDTGYVHMHHQVCFHHGVVWDETTQGTNQGSIHLDPDSGTDHAGGAITFGASDTSSGTTAQGGIYVRTDGSYGTKMYLSTTDSYASGSKTAMKIDHSGKVYVTRGNLFLGNVDTAAATENTALFLNGSTGEVEKRELGSGAFGSGGGTNFITNNADDITTGEIKFQRNDTQSIIESENTSASNAGQFRLKHSYGNMEMRSLRGAMNIFATNTVNLGYGTAIKLATISGGVQVTGKVQASSSIGNLATGTNGQQMEYGTTAVTTLRFDADRWRLYAGAGSGEVFTVEQNGEVGIKDSSPSYELDVNGDIRATGDVIAFSDERVKENIVTIENALDTVTKLRGVQFNKIGQDKKSVGVIAQEVLKVLPEVVAHDKKDMYSVAYGNMVGVLIEAIKELNAEVKELKEKLNN
jgi:hypothetical protein|tara:strand:+ start:67 stop:2313 length:2247 start_codon:yes stop_codon:yes gene_type:complete